MNKIETIKVMLDTIKWSIDYHKKELAKFEVQLGVYEGALKLEEQTLDQVQLDLHNARQNEDL